MKPASRLSIEEKREGPDCLLRFKGAADILCVPVLQDLFARFSKEQIRLLMVDLSVTDFINSPVWAIITLYARKQGHAGRLAIIGMPERIRGSFEMMGLQRELKTYPDADAARRELDSAANP